MADKEVLSAEQVSQHEGLDDWRPLLGKLLGRFETGDFVTGLALVNRVGEAAEEANHHPDLDLRYGYVDVALSSHDVGGLTERDVRLARRISAIAADLDAPSRPDTAIRVEWGLDTWDHPAIKDFWQALLGLEPDEGADDQLSDPDDVLPTVWFQESDHHETPHQRWHPDVWVPHELVAGRIGKALAAGGRVVDDSNAPSYTVLADAQGNRACLCTHRGRSY